MITLITTPFKLHWESHSGGYCYGICSYQPKNSFAGALAHFTLHLHLWPSSLFVENAFHWFSIAGAPSPPRNLKTEVVFNSKSAQTFIRLYWDPPAENGGSKVEKYIIQYIASGLPWNSPHTIETKDTEFKKLHVKLRSGGKYSARVRAQNKAGLGAASNEVLINLGMYASINNKKILGKMECAYFSVGGNLGGGTGAYLIFPKWSLT